MSADRRSRNPDLCVCVKLRQSGGVHKTGKLALRVLRAARLWLETQVGEAADPEWDRPHPRGGVGRKSVPVQTGAHEILTCVYA